MNICFVCYANICRSPMAEFIFKDLTRKEGLNNINISSAGTNVYHSSLMSRGTQEQLKLHNIPFDKQHYSTLFTKDIYDNNDLIIIMDYYNFSIIANQFKSTNKLQLMRSFLDDRYDIFDPYGTQKYDVTFNQIYDSCIGLLKYIKEHYYE